MFSLIELLRRNAHTILFVLLELVSFILIVNFNQQQRDIFIHSSSRFTGSIANVFSGARDYFDLKQVNEQLLVENSKLLRAQLNRSSTTYDPFDSLQIPFEVIPARIIGQTIHSSRNYITIDKGRNHGVEAAMGLITEKGVAGIVKKSTNRFSSAMSLLHTQTRISASLGGTDFFGTVLWDGRDFKKVQLEGIPIYAAVAPGDTVITNGYSSIFPRNLVIGQVSSVKTDPNRTYHQIDLNLANDFYELDYVYVIRNNFAAERQQVELE